MQTAKCLKTKLKQQQGFLRIADSQFLSGVTDTETGTGSGLGNSLFLYFFSVKQTCDDRSCESGNIRLFGDFLGPKVSNKINFYGLFNVATACR